MAHKKTANSDRVGAPPSPLESDDCRDVDGKVKVNGPIDRSRGAVDSSFSFAPVGLNIFVGLDRLTA